ncbi:bifunctional metallophosphatase/5'-nucleotidase [Salipaludibacillus sp. HK11]|uniref:bifunctional metallophosphatase/5'-nucleotidase n=1 Tax=Salipaludibacillus sp. HK11 TaxID=3394320 RepID=UPI0039FC5767
MKTFTFSVGVTSDTHGLFDGMKDLNYLETTFQNFRSQHDSSLLIDNGDSLQGSRALHYYGVNPNQIHPFSNMLPKLGYQAFVPGNHDFDYGWKLFRTLHQSADTDWICANIIDKNNQKSLLTPYRIYTKGPIKVALIGLTIKLPFSDPSFTKAGMEIDDEVEVVTKTLKQLKENEKPDLVIVSYHGGMLYDGPLEPNKGDSLAKIKGIDLLITGHQHQLIHENEKHQPAIIQTGVGGKRIGLASFEFEFLNDQWKLINRDVKLVDPLENQLNVEKTRKDQHNFSKNKIEAWFNKSLTNDELPETTPIYLLRSESMISRWVHEVVADTLKTKYSLMTFSKSELTFQTDKLNRDIIFSIFPYPERIYVYKFSKSELIDLLEVSASMYEGDGSWRLSLPWLEPHPLTYQFGVLGGLKYELDCTKPTGSRVKLLEPIESSVTIAVNGFIANRIPKYEAIFKAKEPEEISSESIFDILVKGSQKGLLPEALTGPSWRVKVRSD